MIKHVFLIKFIPNFKELVIFYFICVFKSLETLTPITIQMNLKLSFQIAIFFLSISSISWSQDVKVLDLKPKDFVYSSAEDRIYFTVSQADDSTRNSLCVLDPYFGKVEKCYRISGQPNVMAMSENGEYIYIGLDSLPQIVRFNMTSRMLDLTIELGGQLDFLGPYYAEDIEVLPDNPEAVVVARRNKGFSPRHEGVAVYENGQMRMQETSDHTGSNSIVFGADNDVLWGYNNETSEFGLRKMSISANGVVEESVTEYLLQDFFDEITFQDGILYSNRGRVVNTLSASPELIGDFGMTDQNDGSSRAVAPAPDSNLVYFVTSDFGENFYLRVFDKTSRDRIRDVQLPSINGNISQLMTWGGEGKLAYITGFRGFDSTDPQHLVLVRYCNPLINVAPELTPVNPGGCQGEEVALFAEAGLGNVFWSNGATTDSILVSDQATYYYAAMDSLGCLSPISNSVSVTYDEKPRTPSILGDAMVEICEDGEVTLISSLSFDYDSFLWSNGDTTQSIVVTTAGSYSVIAISTNGCQSEASEAVVVTVLPGMAPSQPMIQVTGDTIFCSGGETMLAAPDGFAGYLWSTGEETQSIVVMNSGRYTVQVINDAGCNSLSSEPVNIIVNPTPFQPSIFVNQNVLASSYTQGNQWFFNGTLIPNATDQFYTPTESGFYSVQVTIDGCPSELSELVNFILTSTTALINEDQFKVYPNPFSDQLSIELKGVEASQILVYNLLGVVESIIELETSATTSPLTLSQLSSGTYLLQLRNSQGEILANRKIVKMGKE